MHQQRICARLHALYIGNGEQEYTNMKNDPNNAGDAGNKTPRSGAGDRSYSAPIWGTDSDGNEVTVSFGQGSREGHTLISDGLKSDQDFYNTSDGKSGHDHADGKGGYKDRGQYSGGKD